MSSIGFNASFESFVCIFVHLADVAFIQVYLLHILVIIAVRKFMTSLGYQSLINISHIYYSMHEVHEN